MRTEFFMYFCIKKDIGTYGEICRQLKIFLPPLPPPVVYATDHSKAVVPMLFLLAVWLCGLYNGGLHVSKSSRALCPRVSSFLLALWSPRLGKRELVCVLLVHLFVCFVRVSFCHFLFFLVTGVACGFWLWHSLDFSINIFEVQGDLIVERFR